MNARLLFLYRLQWVKFRFHQHDPVHIHRILHRNFFLCGGLKKTVSALKRTNTIDIYMRGYIKSLCKCMYKWRKAYLNVASLFRVLNMGTWITFIW